MQVLDELLKSKPEAVQYSLPFVHRFELLFIRTRYNTCHEFLKISSHLGDVADRDNSLQTHMLVGTIHQRIISMSTGLIENIDERLADCASHNLPCLEVELRLMQLSFYNLIKRCKVKNGIAGSDVPLLDTTDSLKKANRLCRKYPDTAGRFLRHVVSMKSTLQGTSRKPLSPIYTADTRSVERRWGNHAVGHLTTCDNKHPYSTASFDSCPECGREVDVVDDEDAGYRNFLAEDRFLSAMRGEGSAASSQLGQSDES